MIAFFYDSSVVILKFLIPGIFLGAVYDIFRFFRISRNDETNSVSQAIMNRYFPNMKKSKKKIPDTMLVFAEDILFFLIVAITEILATFHLNDGEIRIYCLVVSAIGFFVYQKTMGRLLIFFSKKILYLLRKTICLFVSLILTPCFFIIKKIGRLISSVRKKRRSQKERKKHKKGCID